MILYYSVYYHIKTHRDDMNGVMISSVPSRSGNVSVKVRSTFEQIREVAGDIYLYCQFMFRQTNDEPIGRKVSSCKISDFFPNLYIRERAGGEKIYLIHKNWKD